MGVFPFPLHIRLGIASIKTRYSGLPAKKKKQHQGSKNKSKQSHIGNTLPIQPMEFEINKITKQHRYYQTTVDMFDLFGHNHGFDNGGVEIRSPHATT